MKLYLQMVLRMEQPVLLHLIHRGRSGGAKVMGKLPVPGRPTNFAYSRARAYCRCGWGLFGHFFSHLSVFLFFLPLSGRRSDID